MNIDILLGKTQEHLVPLEGTKFLVHNRMLQDYLRLQNSAKEAGFDLQVISAFRDYDRQLKIWNAKASGERPLLDDFEKPLDYSKLSPTEIVFAILRWSAIPGCSRHHWGSDIDVYDGNTQTAADVKLVPSECENSGPASALHSWLDMQFAQNNSFGFFRPFASDRGGVSPERWHLSYYPVSRRMIDEFSFSIFKNNLQNSDVMFKELLLEKADEIFQRYIMNFELP
jgi:LAS superfamily LD-carboxypeptidase LdcB